MSLLSLLSVLSLPSRRRSLLAAALVLPCAAALAQGRPITVVVSGPPGGPLDAVTRAVFAKAAERLGTTVVVDNRPGAGGVVAVTAVTRAAPDGLTLLSTIDPPIVATPSLLKSVPYDPLKDLVPVAMLGDGGDNVLTVPADSPARTVQELVAALRARPEQANYSSSGNGGPGHLIGELFNRQAGIRATHIPFKGSPDALHAVIAGRVSFGFLPLGLVMPQAAAGKLRVLAVAAAERNPLAPSLPTVAEAGVKDFTPAHWWVIAFAPAQTPRDVVRRLNEALRAATAEPDVAEMLRKQTLRPSPATPEQLGERVRADVAYWSRLIRELGIQAE